jgi:hypothetical protein
MANGVTTHLEAYNWRAHDDNGCGTCVMFRSQSVGGRAKKNGGRPRKSTEGLTTLKKSMTPSWDALQPALFLSPPSTHPKLEDLQCYMCHCIVDRPVEIGCRNLACFNCAIDKQVCPHCSTHDAQIDSHLSPVSDVILKVVGALLLRCPACSGIVQLHELKNHSESNCSSYTVQPPSVQLDDGEQQLLPIHRRAWSHHPYRS